MGIQTTTHTSGACRAVTPDTPLTLGACRALYVGTGGDISIDDLTGETIVLVGVLDGSVLPVQTELVNASGTTATNIVALF